jgi:hypothetical protein
LIAWLLFLTACSGTCSTRNGDGDAQGTEVYPIGWDDALLVMQDAMQKEFPEDRIEDVLSPHRGYSAKMRFVADVDTIMLYAVDGQGRGPEGQAIEGFIFEVHRSGTYPLGGIPTSKTVLKRVVEGASRLSDAARRI